MSGEAVNGDLPVWAVVPAAGSGRRMQSDTPKQFLEFQGKTLIEHCLDRLLSHADIDGAIIVLNDEDNRWEALRYQAEKPLFTAAGGNRRQDSVLSGLAMLQYRRGMDAIALVHDAVRPLVRHEDIARVIAAARQHEAGAILATPVADTLKVEGDQQTISGTLSRDKLWRALTPQVFHLQPLLNALQRAVSEGREITDDAAALELSSYAPALVEGSADNLKITTPADLALAEQIWLYQRDQQDDK